MELQIHPPRATNASTLKILIHRNNITIPLHTLISKYFNTARRPDKSVDSWPSWVLELIASFPCAESHIFLPQYPPQPREISANVFGRSLGSATRFANGHYQVDASWPLAQILRDQEFLEFPTFELFATSPAPGEILILNKWTDADTEKEPTPKRRKMERGTEFVSNILTEYGSDDGESCSAQDGDQKETYADILGYDSENDPESPRSSEQDESESAIGTGEVPGTSPGDEPLHYSTESDRDSVEPPEEDDNNSNAGSDEV